MMINYRLLTKLQLDISQNYVMSKHSIIKYNSQECLQYDGTHRQQKALWNKSL